MNNNKIFLKVFSSEVFSTMFFPSVLTFLGAGLFSLLLLLLVLFLGSGPRFWLRKSFVGSSSSSGRAAECSRKSKILKDYLCYGTIQLFINVRGFFCLSSSYGRQSCTIVHNPKLSQSGYIFIHLHTSPGLRLGFSRLEITDSLIASDAKRSYLPDYANHLSPGCWGVGTCDPCFSCTFCVVLLIVPGYSKSHTAVNAGYLGLGWET